MRASTAELSPRPWAGYLLGFSLGGFFDGILLHQVLQWHHLLLGVRTGPLQDMRVQLMADGLFHVLMYLLTLCGIWLLWRAARAGASPTARAFAVTLLFGFGIWHIVDAVVPHWILGIHRVRMDSPDPLFWDLLWFTVFGVVPLIIAWVLNRGGGGGKPLGRLPQTLAVMLVAMLGIVAAAPPKDQAAVVVLVPPAKINRLLDGLQAAGGGIVWADRSGAVWVFQLRDGQQADTLYGYGAALVTRSPAVLGCLAWSRTARG